MLQVLWNCILFLLLLGLFKASLGLHWRWIGAWKYHELHPSLVYDDSSRLKQFLVNFVFFLVYPGVLVYHCYQAEAGHGWQQEEEDLVELTVDKGLGEDDLLRRGMLRGRMIIQKQIILNDSPDEDLEVTEGIVQEDGDEDDSFENSLRGRNVQDDDEDDASYEESEKPLNLSKDCQMASRKAELRRDSVSIFVPASDDSEDHDEVELFQSTLISTPHESNSTSSTSTIKRFK